MYSGEYDACDVTLSAYPHRASLKNMPVHGENQTRGQAYFSSLPGVDIHSEQHHKHHIHLRAQYIFTSRQKIS